MQNHKSPRGLRRPAWVLVLALALSLTVPSVADARHGSTEATPATVVTASIDAATRHHHPDVVHPPTRIVTVVSAHRFNWGDAGIGAAAMLGAALAIGGTAALLTRNRRTTISSPSRSVGS
jgi:hypothetical protein